ncbi:MAG: UDP-N-acetylmuramoyl-L-alanine--D-glutamate ligase [Gemmatimonadales bacterium]
MSRLDEWRADQREVSVAGLARSGVAAARLLAANGVRAYVSDRGDSAVLHATADALRVEFPSLIGVDIGGHDVDRVVRSAALILSPGIPPDAGVVRAASIAGVPILAEVQLGFDALPDVPAIVITGTNGKTTTTALVDHLMRSAGRRSAAAGNIGNPLSAVARATPPPEWLAVELSSFQLHDCPDLAPTVGILTNLAPDHLDRYPVLDDYYADKALLFRNAGISSIWVSNLDDVDSRAMVANVPGRHLTFSTAAGTRADAWYDRDADTLMLAGKALLPRGELPLLGDHNVANALAAALALHGTGIDHPELSAGLRSFRALRHRMEPVREVDGVLWINDSKATNVASTRVAIQAMTRPFVLLLGGRHKGEPYTDLVGPLCQFGSVVIAYGEAGDLIEHDLGPAIRVVRGTTFEDVVSKARVLAPPGGVVLLSPACSSYDMFDNYEQRGAEFKRLAARP